MTDRMPFLPYAMAGIVGALLAYGVLLAVAMSRNEWIFEYALDDVYIHLAMAEQIAAGGYGVNPGELASAASSPLYPLLLTPLAGSGAQKWLPLFWNILALCAAAALMGWAFAKAGLGKTGLLMAAIAPFALGMYVVAYTGMENMAHGAASLAVVLGFWRFIETNRIGWLLVVGLVLATAFRLEAVALGLAVGGVVAVLGRPVAGLGLMALAVLPAAAFSAYLSAQGIGPLPNSIVAKIGDTGGGSPLETFAVNSATYGGRYLMALSAVVFLIGMASIPSDRRVGYFGLAVGAAGLAHLAFGAIGWMDRYEAYANLAMVAALALILTDAPATTRVVVVAVALLGGAFTYLPYAVTAHSWNPAAIYGQHRQMARLVKDHVKAPVAVNDIGLVAWQNPSYVLDLWGLASSEALAARNTAEPGWAGPLVEDHGVDLVMVYDAWLDEGRPETWVRLGTLRLDVPNAFLGGPEVAFYAARPGAEEALVAAIENWTRDLPPRAEFTFAEGGS